MMMGLAPPSDAETIVATLCALGIAAFVIDADGRVCGSSERARLYLQSGGLDLRDGRLELNTSKGADRVDLDKVFDAHLSGDPRALNVVSIGGGSDLQIVKLPQDEFGSNEGPRLIAVARPVDMPPANEVLLEEFGLTVAEIEVALAIARGKGRRAVAEQRGVSIDTIRSQLKVIYQKLGCRRETELILRIREILG